MDAVFFITGSSKGIGKALAEALLNESEGNWVVGLSRSNSLEHERFVFIETDLSKDVSGLARQLFGQYKAKRQVVLVNNAGTLGEPARLGTLQNQKVEQAFQLNVTAPAILMNEFISAYEQGEAEPLVLNISSGAGKYPVDGWSTYCASKAALDMLSEVAAQEARAGNSHLRVFSLAPGVVDTEMQRQIRQTSEQDFSRVQEFIRMKEEGLLAEPAEVAAKILQLLQQPQRYKEVLQDVRNF